MHFFRAHPYASLFALAGIVIVLIAGAMRRVGTPPPTSPTITISAGDIPVLPAPQAGSHQAPPSATADSVIPAQTAPQPQSVTKPAPSDSLSTGEHTALPPSPASQPPAQSPEPVPSPSPSPSPETAPDTSQADALLQLAYAYHVGGLDLSNAQPQSRTPQQQALYEYGNKAGLAVLTFENANADMGQTLKNWIDHRSDGASQQAVLDIAAGMTAAGESLAALTDVPESAQAANQALAANFQSAATQLQAVVAAGGSDSTLIDSIKTYDQTADRFTQSYVALADVFTFAGVRFSPTDPGSAFSMPQQ